MDWSRSRVQFFQLMEELAVLSQGNSRMTNALNIKKEGAGV